MWPCSPAISFSFRTVRQRRQCARLAMLRWELQLLLPSSASENYRRDRAARNWPDIPGADEYLMDETNNLAPRERTPGGATDALQTRSPFLALDLMPHEPHLLDYL